VSHHVTDIRSRGPPSYLNGRGSGLVLGLSRAGETCSRWPGRSEIGEEAADYLYQDRYIGNWLARQREKETETEEKGDKDGDDGLLAAR
jgi:hypothetical protein